MPQQNDQDDQLARDAADRLLGGANGASLNGPQPRIDRIVGQLQSHLDRSRLFPVVFQADRGSPESLRVAVGQAHADRPSLDTDLLLIVPDAGRLSADLLRELELAAEAASRFGGLKFLLASKGPLRPILLEAGLQRLFDRLDASLSVPSEVSPGATFDAGSTSVDRLPISSAKPARPGGSGISLGARLLLSAAILFAVVVAILLVLTIVRPARQPASTTMAPSVPAASLPPVAAPLPAQIAPPTAAPAIQEPANRTPTNPTAATPPSAAPVQSPQTMQTGPVAPPPAEQAPVATQESSNLLLMAQPGDTLPVLYAKVYAGRLPPPYSIVAALNPIVRPGTRLIFPAPPGGWHAAP